MLELGAEFARFSPGAAAATACAASTAAQSTRRALEPYGACTNHQLRASRDCVVRAVRDWVAAARQSGTCGCDQRSLVTRTATGGGQMVHGEV